MKCSCEEAGGDNSDKMIPTLRRLFRLRKELAHGKPPLACGDGGLGAWGIFKPLRARSTQRKKRKKKEDCG
jgi:hypothetical protein